MVLTPRRWRQVGGISPAHDGDNKPVHRGEHDISRKTIAQGRPDALRCTCMLVCAFFVHLHTDLGAARTRLSLRPHQREENFDETRADRAARTRTVHSLRVEHRARNLPSPLRTRDWSRRVTAVVPGGRRCRALPTSISRGVWDRPASRTGDDGRAAAIWCYPSLSSSYPFAATSSHLAR